MSLWIKELSHRIHTHRIRIIDGAVEDLCQFKDEWKPFRETLVAVLRDNGYKQIAIWSPPQNVSGISSADWQRLFQGAVSQASTTSISFPGEELVPEQSLITCPLGEFLAIARNTIAHNPPDPIAFIVDWGHLLFGDERSLGLEERQRIMEFCNTCRDLNLLDQNWTTPKGITLPLSGLVVVTRSAGNLPRPIWIENPETIVVHVPSPDREARKSFLRRYLQRLQVQPPILDGSSELDDLIDATEGLSLKSLTQVLRLSQTQITPLSINKVLTLFRYGEEASPWEQLSSKKLQEMSERLARRVKGQEHAVDAVREVVVRATVGLSGIQHSAQKGKPRGVLFFAGPTGVGKTELAKALAEFLFGDESAFIRFDMSEYSLEHSDQRLVGAPPGFVGFESGGQLTNAVQKRPFSVLLFDEIEKAHPRILDKFLQILEDGRLTDGRGVTVSFKETIIVFTSNIGAATVKLDQEPTLMRTAFKDAVKAHFTTELKRPELLNRIGENIVPFDPISNPAILTQIAHTKLIPLQAHFRERYHMELVLEQEATILEALANATDKGHGGRGILNVIEQRIVTPLSEWVFENRELFAPNKKIVVKQISKRCLFEFVLE